MKRIPLISYILILFLSALLLSGCRSSGHSVRRHHSHKVDVPVKIDLSGLSKERRALIKEAEEWLGTPYEYGASSKQRGSDCSGMVLSVYLETTGIKLPRNSAKQAEFCRSLKARDVVPGDLVFFATGKDPERISHVGIMVSDEDFIHVSTSKGAVVSKTTTPYYTKTFMGYGRVPGM